jgi:hypothetical protein
VTESISQCTTGSIETRVNQGTGWAPPVTYDYLLSLTWFLDDFHCHSRTKRAAPRPCNQATVAEAKSQCTTGSIQTRVNQGKVRPYDLPLIAYGAMSGAWLASKATSLRKGLLQEPGHQDCEGSKKSVHNRKNTYKGESRYNPYPNTCL